jgi:hypothetical protein
VEDSVAFLGFWNVEERGRIDLLYLDSLGQITAGRPRKIDHVRRSTD